LFTSHLFINAAFGDILLNPIPQPHH